MALSQVEPLVLLQASEVSLAELAPELAIFGTNQILVSHINAGLLLYLLPRLGAVVLPDQLDSFL